MLPRNRLGRAQLRKLKVYAGPDHPHAAQKPEPMEVERLMPRGTRRRARGAARRASDARARGRARRPRPRPRSDAPRPSAGAGGAGAAAEEPAGRGAPTPRSLPRGGRAPRRSRAAEAEPAAESRRRGGRAADAAPRRAAEAEERAARAAAARSAERDEGRPEEEVIPGAHLEPDLVLEEQQRPQSEFGEYADADDYAPRRPPRTAARRRRRRARSPWPAHAARAGRRRPLRGHRQAQDARWRA